MTVRKFGCVELTNLYHFFVESGMLALVHVVAIVTGVISIPVVFKAAKEYS